MLAAPASGEEGKADLMLLGERIIKTAQARLNAKVGTENLACLTNAGWVEYGGMGTRTLYDVFYNKARISLGKGNLLPLHSAYDEDLWFAFVLKKSPTNLLMTYVTINDGSIRATEPLNVYVDKHQSFKAFEDSFGNKAFPLVTLANGWAQGIPEEVMTAALFHGHYCAGVFSGYFTTRFIRRHAPLRDNEEYIYVGIPGYCQDDLIINSLNLTPGKNNHLTMQYPWYRPWKTAEAVYSGLSGIVIAFDAVKNAGRAYLLRFDWHEDDFKKYINEPDLKIDWKTEPWLHNWYNAFFMEHLQEPDYFVSVVKVKNLENRRDLGSLVRLGANPLKEILGEDESW
jgi:formylmethanofuran dehydrogenase subunit E-like metal-binding protein